MANQYKSLSKCAPYLGFPKGKVNVHFWYANQIEEFAYMS